METNRLITTSDPTGFVSLDDTRFPLSIGGIRLIEGVTAHEVDLLAKSMSLKLHSFGFPMSGGKGGINSDSIEDFFKFIQNPDVKDLIQGKGSIQFVTGPDIGTSEELYNEALARAGLQEFIRPGLLSSPSEQYKLPLDNIITAYGVIVVCEELLATQTIRGRDPLFEKTFAIEGFGKVGTGLAKLIENRGILVAISTRYGSLIDMNGLEIPKLIELQSEHGDHCISEYGLPVASTEDLFSVSSDVLIPGARTEVISKQIAQRIITAEIKHIVPVSNYPYTNEGIKILKHSSTTIFPDFIASAGAVIAAMVEFAKVGSEKEAFDLVHAAISQETKDLIAATVACGDGSVTMYDLALERAVESRELLVSEATKDIISVARTIINKYLPVLLDANN